MDGRLHRIERRDRSQEPDRRDGVDGYDLDHPGLAGREIDRAVDIHSLRARSFVRSRASLVLVPSSRQAAPHVTDAPRPRTARLVVGQGIQEIIVALDECLLLLFVEFARMTSGL